MAGEGLGRVVVCSLVASLSSGFQAGVNSTGEPAFCGPGTTLGSQEILMNANDLGLIYRSADSYLSYVESHLHVDRIVKRLTVYCWWRSDLLCHLKVTGKRLGPEVGSTLLRKARQDGRMDTDSRGAWPAFRALHFVLDVEHPSALT